MAEKLRQEFIELLEKDVEFRYIVAGYLGLSEILKRLDRLEEGQAKLMEGQNRLWEEVKGLREGQNRLWEAHDRLRRYVVSGFRDLRRALGVTFEEHASSFLEVMLEEMGYIDARVDRRFFVDGGEVVEVNMFCENPLVVGEATVAVDDVKGAEAEVNKLLKRVDLAFKKYGRRPILTVLCVARSTPEASEALKALCTKHGIKLILGREIEENLSN